MNAAEFAAIYPNIDRAASTGGGCTAFYIPCGDEGGAHALVTDAEGDPCAPKDTDVEGTLGFYDEHGESYNDLCWLLPFEAIEKFIDIQWALWSETPMERLAALRVEWIGNADRVGDETPESEAKLLRDYVEELHGGHVI